MKDVSEIEIVDLAPAETTGSFKVKKGFDYETKFNELANSCEHIAGWSMASK